MKQVHYRWEYLNGWMQDGYAFLFPLMALRTYIRGFLPDYIKLLNGKIVYNLFGLLEVSCYS